MMTKQQADILDLVRKLNGAEFSLWFKPSEVMAFVQTESRFLAHAYRFEPRINEGSYGLMQVLASTAKSVAKITDPETMYQPEISLRVGMKVLKLYWNQEQAHFHRDPKLAEWAAAYNEGVGGAERDVAAHREPDPAYVHVWMAARAFWIAQHIDN